MWKKGDFPADDSGWSSAPDESSDSRSPSESDSEWEPPEERAAKRRKIARLKRKRDDDSYEEPADAGRPDGYVSIDEYQGEYGRGKSRNDLERWGDYVWVKPVKSGIAIWFKPQHVIDIKLARPSEQREESRNEGDQGYTWHHTSEFIGQQCRMQLVPTDAHSGISHFGGVSTHKRFKAGPASDD